MTREEAINEINKVFEPAFANYIITALTEGTTVSDKETTTKNDCETCIHNKGVLECDMYGCKYEPTTKNDLEVDCISKIDALRVAKNEYLRGWHNALCKALSEKYSIHCEEGDFSVIQEETITGLGLSMDCALGKDVESYMSTMPSVTPQEPKTGEWCKQNDDYFDWYECSECGYGSEGEMQYSSEYDVRTYFCPNCGADMREGEDLVERIGKLIGYIDFLRNTAQGKKKCLNLLEKVVKGELEEIRAEGENFVKPKPGEWIRATERLPEESDDYLITNDAGDVEMAYFAHPKDYAISKGEWREIWYEDDVVAWMPLPKPYTGDEE